MDVFIIEPCAALLSNVEVFGPAFHVNSPFGLARRISRNDYSPNLSYAPMPAFASKPLNRSPLYRRLKKNPALFGVPFLLVMVGASFGLQSFTQTRYDLHSQKVTQVRVALRLILPPCSDLFPYKRPPP